MHRQETVPSRNDKTVLPCMDRQEAVLSRSDRALLGLLAGAATASALLWLAAVVAERARGHPTPSFSAIRALRVLTAPADPADAWGLELGSALGYWATVLALALFLAGGAVLLRRHLPRTDGPSQWTRRAGMATRRDVTRAAGAARVAHRASVLRPSSLRASVDEVAHVVGRSYGIRCLVTVEDSTVVLGPPRSGKGLHLVIPAILDAPGSVVTTSTRPDNLTSTMRARQARGPVAVFDPQGLAPGIPSAARWSPIRGCEDPHVAMVRAKALTKGAASGTTDANFWQSSAEQAVRALLHAAALGGCDAADLYRWSLSAVHAREAVMILSTSPQAARSWHQGLDSIISADPRQRDSVWAMVSIAFAALADPRVLDAVSPAEGEHLDPAHILENNGTVYLLGTSTGAAATAGLVGAFLEDVLEVARRKAAGSPGSRLDPPLSMILDEAANYPLPSLASLMSDGGGSGIATTVVLQSLAQARAVWGEHAASAIWDAAIVKLILGGGSNARDLDDLSKLIGTRPKDVTSRSTGHDGRRSTSTSTSEAPILTPAELRTLPFGSAVLLLRSAPPIALTMSPWLKRKDAKALTAARTELEQRIRDASAARA